MLKTFLSDLGVLSIFCSSKSFCHKPYFRASPKHWQNAKSFLPPSILQEYNLGWKGGKPIAQMALWDVLVLPVVLENPSGTLTTYTACVLGAKPLQGVGIGKSFLPEDSCLTVMVRMAWYGLYI